MLKSLTLKNIGPAPEMTFAFGKRLNLVTGDNGLGKTFLLDMVWWALTRTWIDGKPIHPLFPDDRSDMDASVVYRVAGKGKDIAITRKYDRGQLGWEPYKVASPPIPGIVVYARIDGGFSVWDPERNYWKTEGVLTDKAFHFTKEQVFFGDERENFVFPGLLRDWETWRFKHKGVFDRLSRVLKKLSPPEHALTPGHSVRVPGREGQDIPTIIMPYGEEPVLWASAGIRRALSLAYMLTWAWTEHVYAARTRGHIWESRIVFLWDEVDAHLHPQWQRSILPAVLDVVTQYLQTVDDFNWQNSGGMGGGICCGGALPSLDVQLIATTHAPLVLASLEPVFDEAKDKLFNLQYKKDAPKEVEVEEVPWAKHGDAVEWLCSDAFDMKSGYSKEAEEAMRYAQRWLDGDRDGLPDDYNTQEKIKSALEKTLPGTDPFWLEWDFQGNRENDIYD
jgi:hypothetical protein